MANKTSWKSIGGNAFRRKMWFARLRAAGNYINRCKGEKGKCKNLTGGSAKVLKANEFANVSPRDGKAAMAKMQAKGRENAKKGLFADTKGAQAARVALVKNIRQTQQEKALTGGQKVRGGKFDVDIKGRKATVKSRQAGERTVGTTSAVGVRSDKAKRIKSEQSRQSAQSMRKKERTGKVKSTQQRELSNEFSSLERGERTPTPATKKEKWFSSRKKTAKSKSKKRPKNVRESN